MTIIGFRSHDHYEGCKSPSEIDARRMPKEVEHFYLKKKKKKTLETTRRETKTYQKIIEKALILLNWIPSIIFVYIFWKAC